MSDVMDAMVRARLADHADDDVGFESRVAEAVHQARRIPAERALAEAIDMADADDPASLIRMARHITENSDRSASQALAAVSGEPCLQDVIAAMVKR